MDSSELVGLLELEAAEVWAWRCPGCHRVEVLGLRTDGVAVGLALGDGDLDALVTSLAGLAVDEADLELGGER